MTCEDDCRGMLGLSDFEALRFPVVEFPGGERLFGPRVREIADRLGWVTTPRYKEYDLSIYGAGPAGLSAAVYAASEGLRTVLIERHAVGGQAGTSSLIENYMGFPQGISGAALAERARQQAVKFGAELIMMGEGLEAEFRENRIHVRMADGSRMVAKSNICATGVDYRRLGVRRRGPVPRIGPVLRCRSGGGALLPGRKRLCRWRRQFRRSSRHALRRPRQESDHACARLLSCGVGCLPI